MASSAASSRTDLYEHTRTGEIYYKAPGGEPQPSGGTLNDLFEIEIEL